MTSQAAFGAGTMAGGGFGLTGPQVRHEGE